MSVASARPPGHLVTQALLELLGRARELRAAAGRAISSARDLVESQQHRLERDSWRTIQRDLSTDPNHLVVVCAYCGRVRTHDCQWVAIPRGAGEALRRRADIILSHSFCPGCLSDRFDSVVKRPGAF